MSSVGKKPARCAFLLKMKMYLCWKRRIFKIHLERQWTFVMMLLIDVKEQNRSVTDFHYNLVQVARHWLVCIFGFFFNLFQPLNTFFFCVLCILGNTPGYMQFRIQNICRQRYSLSCQVGTNISGLWCPQVCCWWVPPFPFSLNVRGRVRNHSESFQACVYGCTFNIWAAADI